MKISETRLKTVTVDVVALEVEVKPEDYTEVYNKHLLETQQKVSLKGYRKGKAPLALVAKVYGERSLAAAVEHVMVEALEKHVKDAGKILYSNPNVVSYPTKWVNGETFKASFTVKVTEAPKPEEKSAE